MNVTVDPAEFTFVDFDAGRIDEITARGRGGARLSTRRPTSSSRSTSASPSGTTSCAASTRSTASWNPVRSSIPSSSGSCRTRGHGRWSAGSCSRRAIGSIPTSARRRWAIAVDLPPRVAWDVYSSAGWFAWGAATSGSAGCISSATNTASTMRRRRVRSPVVSRSLTSPRSMRRSVDVRPPVGGAIGRQPGEGCLQARGRSVEVVRGDRVRGGRSRRGPRAARGTRSPSRPSRRSRSAPAGAPPTPTSRRSRTVPAAVTDAHRSMLRQPGCPREDTT